MEIFGSSSLKNHFGFTSLELVFGTGLVLASVAAAVSLYSYIGKGNQTRELNREMAGVAENLKRNVAISLGGSNSNLVFAGTLVME